jgi:hypothetical protein
VGLSAGEHLDCGEILQILMICHHVNWRSRAFEIMSPDSECFKDGQEFFVVGVVVQFGDAQGSGMECNGMNMSVVELALHLRRETTKLPISTSTSHPVSNSCNCVYSTDKPSYSEPFEDEPSHSRMIRII